MEDNKTIVLIQKGFKGLSYLSLVLGVVFFIVLLVMGGAPESPRILSVVSLILGAVYFMFFLLISEVLGLLVKIEKNTRKDSL